MASGAYFSLNFGRNSIVGSYGSQPIKEEYLVPRGTINQPYGWFCIQDGDLIFPSSFF